MPSSDVYNQTIQEMQQLLLKLAVYCALSGDEIEEWNTDIVNGH